MTTTACAFDQTVATGRSALEIATINKKTELLELMSAMNLS